VAERIGRAEIGLVWKYEGLEGDLPDCAFVFDCEANRVQRLGGRF
jgi:hypothetical protein